MALITSDIYIDLGVVLVTLATITVLYFKWAFNYWNQKGVPTLPVSIPFGNARDAFYLRKTFTEMFRDVYDELKPKGHRYAGFYLSIKPVLLVFDPELIKNIMTRDFMNFTDHGNYINEELDPMTGNLFALKGLKWKNLRTKLSPTFTSGKMKMMFQTLVDCSGELTNVMDELVEKKEAVEIKEIVARFTTDIIGSCAFGLDCNSLKDPNAEFRTYGKKIFEVRTRDAFKNLLAFIMPQVLDYFRIPVSRTDVSAFFSKAVKSTVKYREENNVIRKDFMHLLIQLKNNVKILDGENAGQLKSESSDEEVGKTLNMNELIAQAFVFFVAGYETSSTTLTFCFYELVRNPEIQQKLRDEINEVLEKHDGKITYAALMEMNYMDKCINETLRKYPPAPSLFRECTETYKMPDSDLIVDKGTLLFLPMLAIQNDAEHYPDPERFDPERFSPENKAKRHHYTWLPFGEGPRVCIGLRFGMMQTKVALTVLLRSYKFALNNKTKLPITTDPKSFILTIEGGLWLSVNKI